MFNLPCGLDRLKSANFPVRLLPRVVPLYHVVGYTADFNDYSLKKDIPVMISYGDLQSIMFLALYGHPVNTIGKCSEAIRE